MIYRAKIFAACLGFAILLGSAVMAETTANQAVTAKSVANSADTSSDKPISLAVDKLLKDPTDFNTFVNQFINSGWNTAHSSNAVLSFINELHLRPMFFSASGVSDSAVFGLAYDYNKSVQNKTLNQDSINPAGLSFNIFAKGTIAENANKNPNNFLESGIKLHFFQAIGGMTPVLITDKSELDARDAAKTAAAKIKSKDFRNDPVWINSGRAIMQYCRPQFSYDIALQGSLESDQTFDNKQWSYGGQVALTYQDWQNDSAYNWFNVIDVPFAFIRSFTMEGDRLTLKPSGQAFPVLIGGVDMVHPKDNITRLKVDPNQAAYPRFRAEVGFKTQVTRLSGTDIWLSADYRYFREINASSLIRTAGLDEFNYFVVRLDLPARFNVSYSTGKLPLDRSSAQMYAIGYAINFD